MRFGLRPSSCPTTIRKSPKVARFASDHCGVHAFYQAIEQNYNTSEDPRWFEHSENWIRDTEGVIAVIHDLIHLKREGLAHL